MKTNPRAWYIGGALAVVLFGYLGWMFVVKPVYAAASQTLNEAETTETQTERVVLQTKELAVQEKDLQEQIDALMRIRAKIPKDVNVPKLMRTIQSQARAEGVAIDSPATRTRSRCSSRGGRPVGQRVRGRRDP